MTREQAAQDIEKLLSDNVGIDVTIDASDLEYGMDVDALERVVDIDRAISEQCEIIYYSRALEFLEKNDPSLHEAMDCAQEYGYQPKDLSSEILATLLNERQMRNAYWDWRDDIQSILDDIDDPDDEEDIEGCKGVGLVSALQARFDGRASFYGKAQIDDHDDHITLYSYDTEVARYDKVADVLEVFGYYGATTARHIREFARQLGFTIPKGSDIEGTYRH